MQLTFKILVFFLFFSLILFAFSGKNAIFLPRPTPPAPVKTKSVQAIKVGELPDEVDESSGIELGIKPGTYLTHNDAGNAPELFKMDAHGKLLATYQVAGAENIDWEDITRDTKGNIYIGDFGNNSNKRKVLKIYKLVGGSPSKIEIIEYEYADRKAGTADRKHYEFDCEALYWYRNKLYLITKDREDKINARLYELSDQPGLQEARPISNYDINAAVTAADISPDGKTLLLLSEGNIHLFANNGTPNFFKSKMQSRSLGKVGQTEGVVFTDNITILITSEKGNIYRYEL